MGWEETLLQKNGASAALLQKTGFSRVACFKAGFFFNGAFIHTAVYSLFTILALSQNGKEGINLSASTTGGRFSIFNSGETRIGYFGAQDDKICNLSVYNNSGTRIGGFPAY